jgi:hypothetical protein
MIQTRKVTEETKCMPRKKAMKESDNATRADVEKEMAKPRVAKSAREEEVNLAAARTVRVP